MDQVPDAAPAFVGIVGAGVGLGGEEGGHGGRAIITT
jgi:hypothetical protein